MITLKKSVQNIQKIESIAFIIHIETGIIHETNQYTLSHLGYSAADLVGKNYFEILVPPEERNYRLNDFKKIVNQVGFFNRKKLSILTQKREEIYITIESVFYLESEDNQPFITLISNIHTQENLLVEQKLYHFQGIISNTSGFLFLIDWNEKVVFLNDSWKQLGYRNSDNLTLGQMVHPNYYKSTLAQLKKIQKGDVIKTFKTVLRKKNGKRLYVSGSVNSHFVEGINTGFHCIFHDTTQQVRAELAKELYYQISKVSLESLDLNEYYKNIHKELSKVIDAKNFFISQYNPKDGFIYFPYYEDEFFHQHIHFTRRKIGNGIVEYAIRKNKSLRLEEKDILDLAKRKEIYIYTKIPKVFLCVPLRVEGRVTGIIGLKSYERTNKYDTQDIELLEFISGQIAMAIARKHSEDELKRKTSRLTALLEGNDHLIWSMDRFTKITTFNQNYASFLKKELGISPQVYFSLEPIGFRLVNKETQKKIEGYFKVAFNGFPQRFEIEVQTKNGTLWLEILFTPIFWENEVKEISCFAKDISSLKISQNQLVQSKEQAEHLLKAKEQFLANMSHEIRTPMNGVIGMIDLLNTTNLTEEQRTFVKTIQKSSETLLVILNDILDLSKIVAGKMELHLSVVALKDVFDKLFTLFASTAHQKRNSLVLKLSNDLPVLVEVDETRLLQILSNLISNALKFTEKGKIEVYVERVSSENSTHTLRIEVNDTGIGIDKKNIELLFASFQQIDHSFSKSFGGTGLGLAISKELTKLMNGKIGVESELGVGSCFWIEIEVEEKNDSPIHPQLQNPINNTRFLGKILVVDDNFVNRQVASQLLKKKGLTVSEAKNGKEALQLVEKEFFDLIFMDIQMPEWDGIVTLHQLQKLPKNLPPVIAMTAYSMPEDEQHFIKQGMDDYISKPVSWQKISQILEKWMPRFLSNDPKIIESLRNIIGIEAVEEVINEFYIEFEAQKIIIERAYQEHDFETLTQEFHTLKGSAATLGFSEIAENAKKIEEKIRQKDLTSFRSEWNYISKVLLSRAK